MSIIAVTVGLVAIVGLFYALRAVRAGQKVLEIERVNMASRAKERDQRTWDQLTANMDVRVLRDSSKYHYAPSYFDHKGKASS